MTSKATAVMIALLLLALAPIESNAQDAATAYRETIEEIMAMRGTAAPRVVIDTAERRLLEFLEKYPGTPEAASAHLMLGQVYSSIGRNDDAVRHVKTYLAAEGRKDPKEETTALYVLANIHINREDFDEAEKVLKQIVGSGDQVDPRAAQMASRELARLGTLRRLVIGAEAVPFSAKSTSGADISLEDYRGKVVLIDFWASWCMPCKQEMPNVKKVYREFHDKGFEIIGVSLDNSEANFDRYIREQKIAWPQIFDGKGWMSGIGRMYAVSAIPATFLLDRDGKIRYKNLRGEELYAAVAGLIAQRRTSSSE
jgi:peroxiredoxin